VLDGDPAPLPKNKKEQSPPIFGRCLLWPNGRPSQLLLITYFINVDRVCHHGVWSPWRSKPVDHRTASIATRTPMTLVPCLRNSAVAAGCKNVTPAARRGRCRC